MADIRFLTFPNVLTALRIVLAPVVFYFSAKHMYVLAVVIFWVSSVSDFFDGFLARHLNCESSVGRILDPVADKMLTLFSYLSLYSEFPKLSWLVVARDVGIVAAVALGYVLRLDIKIAPLRISKLNTVFVLLFPFLWLYQKAFNTSALNAVLLYLSWTIVGTTILSSIGYAVTILNISKIKDENSK
ncbi:MAG: CDP-alcohol phosphatidyltransferase family protein [Holosporales bacterium]|jgi:cardiolipin synthase|nr:CDP-alcohol phosphatidyltransferase family protein [Holosporales bacterium]